MSRGSVGSETDAEKLRSAVAPRLAMATTKASVAVADNISSRPSALCVATKAMTSGTADADAEKSKVLINERVIAGAALSHTNCGSSSAAGTGCDGCRKRAKD